MKESDITICGHGSGTPSLKNLEQYLTHRQSLIAPNGVHKGLVAVVRLRAMDEAGREAFVKHYKQILGRNLYSQAAAKRVCVYTPYTDGRYYSDCSSSGCATYRLTYPNTPLTNTAGMLTKTRYWQEVDVGIRDGHITAPEALEIGDALLFAGDNPARVRQIGHVEYVYEMPAETEERLQVARKSDPAFNRVWVTTGRVHIRTGAGTSFASLGIIPKGTEVRCYKYYNTTDAGAVWLLVKAGKMTGYVSKRYLK